MALSFPRPHLVPNLDMDRWHPRRMLAGIRSEDIVFLAGCVSLVVVGLFLLGVPAYQRLEVGAKLAAVRGNAATIQLAAETYAAGHLGRYPADVLDLVPLLPGGAPPRNPFTGQPNTFKEGPGEVTYEGAPDGHGYVITAWLPAARGQVIRKESWTGKQRS